MKRSLIMGPAILIAIIVVIGSFAYYKMQKAERPLLVRPVEQPKPQIMPVATPPPDPGWMNNLRTLGYTNTPSVAGLRGFLAQNEEGHADLRAAMIAALAEIGGADATNALLQTMQTTTFPADISAIAKILPEQYKTDILAAARQELTLAAQDQLNNVNVGPLFEILAGAAGRGADISGDLTQSSSKWPYYAATTMAGLTNGTGIPLLTQFAQDGDGGNQVIAAEALAELAWQNSQAVDSLADLVKRGILTEANVVQIAPYLGGRQFQIEEPADPAVQGVQTLHIANGNQDFSIFETINNLNENQVEQRLAVIGQLLQALPPSDALAKQALLQQQMALNARPHSSPKS